MTEKEWKKDRKDEKRRKEKTKTGKVRTTRMMTEKKERKKFLSITLNSFPIPLKDVFFLFSLAF